MKQSKSKKLVIVKRIILSAVLVLAIAGSSVWASPVPEVNDAVQESFKKEFAGAKLIEWNEEAGLFRATFILGGHRTQAYFNEDGKLEGSIRTLFYNQLPLAVMTAVDKRFSKADIWDVNEINNSLGTVYRVTLESKHKKFRVRLDASGNIIDLEKVKK